jgi:hypothetical protein
MGQRILRSVMSRRYTALCEVHSTHSAQQGSGLIERYVIYTWRTLRHDLKARARTHQGNLQPQRNRNFREMSSDWVEHVELNGATQIEETATRLQRNLWKTKRVNSQATEQASLLTVALQSTFVVFAVLTCFCVSFSSLDGTKGWWSC